MPTRKTLTLTDDAVAVLEDPARVPFLEQGAWVSRAIMRVALQEEAERRTLRARIAELERELAKLKIEVEKPE
jgi:hypothetical protein